MAKKIVWKNFVGQQRIKDALASAFENNTLGHAYLFCGGAGVGKFQAALELAFALLCDNEGEVPCYRCRSCNNILSYSHPDFHMVFPVSLDKSHKSPGDSSKLSEEGWKYIAGETVKKVGNPYAISETRLMNMSVDWIRELNHSIVRGTILGKKNVSIICDVDLMQAATANAMLKTLEEPPSNTVIFLLSERPHAVLPTIRSRCQIFRFGSIAEEELRDALSGRCSMDPQDTKITYAIESSDGSFGRALSLMKEPLNIYAEEAHKLWRLCVNKASFFKVTTALEGVCDKVLGGGYDYEKAEKLLLSFLHMFRIQFFNTITHEDRYTIQTQAGGLNLPSIETDTQAKLYACCEKAVSGVRARGNILLILITFLLSNMEMLHEQEQ